MKLGWPHEYIINLSSPWWSHSGATVNLTTAALSTTNNYVAGLFVPHYDLQVNRIAFVVTTVGNSIFTGGMTTVNASGLPNGDGGALTFINSGTTSTFAANTYSQISFADTTLTAGTEYYMAARVSTYTSTVTVATTMSNGSHGGLMEYPMNARRIATTSSKQPGFSLMCCGYNDGTTTQWYGCPSTINAVSQALNTSGTAVASAGCRFKIPSNFSQFFVKAVGIVGTKAVAHSLVCQILESDNSTQVTNATSTINNVWSSSTGLGHFHFHFDNGVVINSNQNYYLKISATGTAGNGTAVQYIRVNGSALSTSTPANAEFMNAYNIVNNFSTTSTGAVYTEYDNARVHAYLICESFVDSYRGTKENGYSGY
jgi:hypothetical protein